MSSTETSSCVNFGRACQTPTNFPSFIDTGACLCGLLNSQEASANGNRVEKWRCIGNPNDNVRVGGTGKWYNTTLPSEELSGTAQDQNWDENDPDSSEAFVLVNVRGQRRYERLGSNGSPQLIGDDEDCTGERDTMLTGRYYRSGRNPSDSESSSMASATSSMMSSASSSMMMSSSASASASSASEMSTSAAATTSAAPSATEAAASPSPSSDSSAAPQIGFKAIMLFGMLLAPVVAMMV